MQLDSRIPLGIQQISIADILKNAEALKSSAQERAYRSQLMKRQADQDQRDADFRNATADYVSAGGSQPPAPLPVAEPGDEPGAPPPPASQSAYPDMARTTAPISGGVDPLAPMPSAGPGQDGGLVSTLRSAGALPGPQGPSAPGMPSARSPREEAFHRMVLADPKSAFEARDMQFKNADAQLDAIARLAGSAYDQPSYESALQRASNMGLDVSTLPRQFDPRIASQVLNEALSAKDRLAAERANMKLENDIYDDQADNERADENLQSLEDYRSGQLSNTRRGQDMTDERIRGSAGYRGAGRNGQGGKPPASENAVYADIMHRWTQGATPNARELAFVRSYEARHTPRGRGRGRMGGAGGGMSGQMGGQPSGGPPAVNSIAEARALPPGTVFTYQGKVYRKK